MGKGLAGSIPLPLASLGPLSAHAITPADDYPSWTMRMVQVENGFALEVRDDKTGEIVKRNAELLTDAAAQILAAVVSLRTGK